MANSKEKTWTHEDLWGTKPDQEPTPNYQVVSQGLGNIASQLSELPQFHLATLLED